MRTYPLPSLSLEEAMALQFRLIDEITQVFDGREILSLGDMGVVGGINKPTYTQKVEQVLARFFQVEAATLVRGAGTGALRWALISSLQCGERLLVHDAPIYPTTEVTIHTMGLQCIRADFNNLEKLQAVLQREKELKAMLVQHTRQQIEDAYDYEEVIRFVSRMRPDMTILTDDNYAVIKVDRKSVV